MMNKFILFFRTNGMWLLQTLLARIAVAVLIEGVKLMLNG